MAVLLAAVGCAASAQTTPPTQPNILFIVTDDQNTESLRYMPNVRQLMSEGTTFQNATFSYPWCCPSRASILRGQYPHNTGIWSNRYPSGGALLFRQKQLDASTVATWLDDAGYETGLIGKYLNEYDSNIVPPGWDSWYAHREEKRAGFTLNENGRSVDYERRVADVTLSRHASQFVEGSAPSEAPFFAFVGFNAPHYPSPYQKRYANDFKGVPLPRSPNFDERDVSDKPAWIADNSRLDRSRIAYMTRQNRKRLRSLQTVDRSLGTLVDRLRQAGELDNTFIFYWTDNGYHMGNHRMGIGKQTPYIEDIEFPLIVRGPGVPAGAVRDELILNTDLAPTFADLGGGSTPSFVDGRSFLPLLRGAQPPWREVALIEAAAADRGAVRQPDNPSYRALRTVGRTYVEYETGERELYDLLTDPYQLENVYGRTDAAYREQLTSRLRALKGCAAESCRTAEDAAF